MTKLGGEVTCNGLYLLHGKDFSTDEVNVMFSTLMWQSSFKSEIQLPNVISLTQKYTI